MVFRICDVFDLLFPQECVLCGAVLEIQDRYLCLHCLSELPMAEISNLAQNPLEKVFAGRLPLVAATSLFYFERKGMVQDLLHQLKYHNKSFLGNYLGTWLALEMKESKRFTDIDYVVPVPMHPKKLRKRGYNQVSGFANSIASELGAKLKESLLIKTKDRETQTLRNRLDRLEVLKDDFVYNPEDELNGKHILLVDDIITSGATLEACGLELLKNGDVQLSLASMAFTV